MVEIRQFEPHDAATFHAFRLRALTEAPEAFGTTHEEALAVSLEAIAERLTAARRPEGRVVFGAYESGALVGIVGCMQQARTKSRHTATVWGMFVAPEARGRGIGRALMQQVIEEARSWPGVDRIVLTVVERGAAARALYLSLGFTIFGREEDGLRQDGVRDVVEYLALDLSDRSADE
jgi:ribosomal protein S18 acetylase RimI-like enzyme